MEAQASGVKPFTRPYNTPKNFPDNIDDFWLLGCNCSSKILQSNGILRSYPELGYSPTLDFRRVPILKITYTIMKTCSEVSIWCRFYFTKNIFETFRYHFYFLKKKRIFLKFMFKITFLYDWFEALLNWNDKKFVFSHFFLYTRTSWSRLNMEAT